MEKRFVLNAQAADEDYMRRVAAFMKREGLEILCPESGDTFFSWKECQICGQIAGDRQEFTGVGRNPDGSWGEPEKYEGCSTCACYVANGDLDPESNYQY